jgi:hypothetical protein
MARWGEFASGSPELAEKGRKLLYQTGGGEAMLATVSGGAAPPRIHPIAVGIVEGGLYAFILPSPKLTDLEDDGRYALHAYPDPAVPHELQIRGRVRRVDDQTRNALAKAWSFDVGSAWAYEFLIEDVLVGERDSRNDWPPRYSSWSAGGLG